MMNNNHKEINFKNDKEENKISEYEDPSGITWDDIKHLVKEEKPQELEWEDNSDFQEMEESEDTLISEECYCDTIQEDTQGDDMHENTGDRYGDRCGKHDEFCKLGTVHYVIDLERFFGNEFQKSFWGEETPTSFIWCCEPVYIKDILDEKIKVIEALKNGNYHPGMEGADHCSKPTPKNVV